MIKNSLTALVFLVSVAVLRAGESTTPDTTSLPIGITEKTGQFIPDSLWFVTENGDSVNLKSMINKPTILAFVYFDCPGICSPLLDGVSKVVSRSDMEIGKEYQIITISIDSMDTPAKARQKKHNFAEKLNKPGIAEGWHFLTGRNSEIQKITHAAGFGFRRQGKDFVHSAAIIVVSPHAKITRYLFGTYFLPFDLKMAVVEAEGEQTGPTINKVLQFCFNYDPSGRKYVLDITRITGTVIISLVSLMFVILIFKPKKTKPEENKEKL